MFNSARGSLLVAGLFHAQMNNPIWPDAQPWGMLLFVAVAILVAVVNRSAMLDRGQAVTTVLVLEDAREASEPEQAGSSS